MYINLSTKLRTTLFVTKKYHLWDIFWMIMVNTRVASFLLYKRSSNTTYMTEWSIFLVSNYGGRKVKYRKLNSYFDHFVEYRSDNDRTSVCQHNIYKIVLIKHLIKLHTETLSISATAFFGKYSRDAACLTVLCCHGQIEKWNIRNPSMLDNFYR